MCGGRESQRVVWTSPSWKAVSALIAQQPETDQLDSLLGLEILLTKHMASTPADPPTWWRRGGYRRILA